MVLTLTALGSLALFFVTLKYYWGERGKPPLNGEERREQRDKELAMRAKQFEYSKKNPIKPRKLSFWDNRKSS